MSIAVDCREEIYRWLQANKKEEAIDRVGKALGTLSPILENFDEENSISALSGIHHIPKFDKDLKTIVQSLRRAKVFSKLANTAVIFRFPNPGMFCTVKTTPNLFNGPRTFEIIFFTI